MQVEQFGFSQSVYWWPTCPWATCRARAAWHERGALWHGRGFPMFRHMDSCGAPSRTRARARPRARARAGFCVPQYGKVAMSAWKLKWPLSGGQFDVQVSMRFSNVAPYGIMWNPLARAGAGASARPRACWVLPSPE